MKAVLPSLIEAMERHGRLNLDSHVRQRLVSASRRPYRLLKPIRETAGGRRKRPAKRKKASRQIPVRTFADWNAPPPGFLEIDLVVHCGGTLSGAFVHSLVATDVCSGWTEAVPLLAREQSLVVEGLHIIGRQLPVPILGIDSDNDSVFINETLVNTVQTAGLSSPVPGHTERTTRLGSSRRTGPSFADSSGMTATQATSPVKPWPTCMERFACS